MQIYKTSMRYLCTYIPPFIHTYEDVLRVTIIRFYAYEDQFKDVNMPLAWKMIECTKHVLVTIEI